MTKKILSIIPARGGSKALARKNIKNIAGKPLIAWTIQAALNSKYITKTVVSSEDDEILKISQKNGADVIKRPEELASDTATSESVVLHALDFLSSYKEEFDIVVLLQPSSPLRTSKDIDNAFELMFDDKATAVISVYEADNKILKAFKYGESGYVEGISNIDFSFMRRQDLPKIFMPNGAIYIVTKNAFTKYNSFATSRTSCYIMPIKLSIDIDSEGDLKLAEKRLLSISAS